MSYLVFARKWRPQNFDEVIGQEHIATTLKNAISLNRVAHAYLFSGPRGIGKTSTARILAKALNCQKGPAPVPCNRCDECREISEGRSLDVIEIDGASNRGIEQIRQLRENVKFAPAKGRFKIYIIDEVHQITTDGFNALLKTLEEPPAHVKFIFATTQAYKVLSTILSRCQRFDFKPLAVSSIARKLKQIIKLEKLDITDDATLYIARASAGSMRDAESILDQLISFCKGQVKIETVTSMLGTIDLEALWEISQKIIQRQMPQALVLVEKIINEGKDLSQFITGLMEHFRNILITKAVDGPSSSGLIDLPGDFISRISEQGKGLALEEIFYIFSVLVRTQESLRRALSSRVIVELAIVKLTQRGNLSSLEEILARLNRLEQNLTQGSAASITAAAQPSSSAKAAPDNPAYGAGKTNSSQPVQAPPSSSAEMHPHSEASWRNLVQAVKKEKMFVASSLEMGHMAAVKGKVLTVAFAEKDKFYKETLENAGNKKFVETKAKEIFGRELRIEFILDKNLKAAAPEEKQTSEESLESLKKASAEPIIKSALNLFQGRLIRKVN
jgi:DNA polymerase-3 subunit gamma/tau